MKENHVINSQLIQSDYDKDYPLIERGKGIFIYDQSGKEYIDGCGCTAAVTSIGHGVEEVAQAIGKQAKKLAVHPTHLFYNQALEEYLQNLCEFAPAGFNKAWTISGGTEAVENAVKLAFQHQRSLGRKRTKVIGRWGSYHGNSLCALDIGGMKARRDFFTDLMIGHLHVDACFPYRRPEGMDCEEYENSLVNQFKRVVEENKDEIMCFIAEPIVGAALGAVAPTENYFKKIRDICDEHGILIISDEVMTGFGRTGRAFGCQHFGEYADILACAKGITSGYFPVGAIVAHDRVLKPLQEIKQPFFSGQTYSCIPLAASAGSAVLKFIQEKQLVKNSENIGKYLKSSLEDLKEFGCVGDVRGLGLFLGIEFVKDKKTKEAFGAGLMFSKQVEKMALEEGLAVYAGRGTVDYTDGDHILLAPPLTLKKEEADLICERLKRALRKIMDKQG